MERVFGLLALLCGNEIAFGVADAPGWFKFDFEDSIVYNLMAFEDLGGFASLHLVVSMRYRYEWPVGQVSRSHIVIEKELFCLA